VTDRLEVDAVGGQHVGAVVVRVVELADAGSAVVGAARRDRRLVERVDGRPVGRRDRDVAGRRLAATLRDPDGERALRAAVARREPATFGIGSIASFIPSGARAAA